MADAGSAVLRVPPRYGPAREFLGVSPALVLPAAAALLVPRLASSYWTWNVMFGLLLGISCLGLLVLVGWAREISLAQAGLTGSAVYLSQHAYSPDGEGRFQRWPYPLAAALGIGFAVAVSFLAAVACVRLAGAYVMVLTLSVGFLLENTVMASERLTGGLCDCINPRPPFFGVELRSDNEFYYVVLGSLFVVMVFLHRARRSRFGRAMILVGSDPVAAACAGVCPWRYRVWAFVVAGAFAGLAGALSGPLYFSPPTLPYIWLNSIVYLAVPVLAGFDSIAGTVVVAVALTLLPQVVLEWELNVYLLGGIGMAVGCLLGPRGLGGLLSDRMRS